MDQPRSNTSNAPSAKRRRLNNQAEITPAAKVVPVDVAALKRAQTAAICELELDCFEEVFDYMPLIDLKSIGQTCKYLNRVAGFHFHQTYPAAEVGCQSDEAKLFPKFIRKVTIDNWTDWPYFLRNHFEFVQVEIICLKVMCFMITKAELDGIILKKVNYLILCGDFDASTLDTLINWCPKLNRLVVCGPRGGELPLKNYPMLEHFESSTIYSGILEFLRLNPNIHSFATQDDFFTERFDEIKISNVKLDVLSIRLYMKYHDDFPYLIPILHELHELSFYKKLELYFRNDFEQEHIDKMVTLKGLVKLSECGGENNYRLSGLTNLKEICFMGSKRVEDFMELPKKLKSLERIQFTEACLDDILQFIKEAVNVNKIAIQGLHSKAYLESYRSEDDHPADKIINLRMLNKERQKLASAKNRNDLKVTIYVEEEAYLATKWAMNGNDCGLIQIRQLTSYEWYHGIATCVG